MPLTRADLDGQKKELEEQHAALLQQLTLLTGAIRLINILLAKEGGGDSPPSPPPSGAPDG